MIVFDFLAEGGKMANSCVISAISSRRCGLSITLEQNQIALAAVALVNNLKQIAPSRALQRVVEP
jgi:hypothetical protein